MTKLDGAGLESSHITVCSGMQGFTDGPVHTAAVFGAPITGLGRGSSLTNKRYAQAQANIHVLQSADVS